ncbi:MAG: cyclase family protein [Nocardioides sp.]
MSQVPTLGGPLTPLPTYAELLQRTDAPPGSAWGLFGDQDELGTLNRLTPEIIAGAARLVRRGTVFNLDLPIHAFDPPITHRTAARHEIFSHAPYHRDDRLDGLYLQGTSQIDGLRHFRHPAHGFYNGVTDEAIVEGRPELGVNRMAERGIVGRGVLLDVASHRASSSEPVDQTAPSALGVADLEAARAAQGVTLAEGDILLVRTGWVEYVAGAGAQERAAIAAEPVSPGLEQSHEMVGWLWDHGVSMVASDNLGVEVMPPVPRSAFRADPSLSALQGRHIGMAHPVLLALLGMPLGELWQLDALAADCREDGVWEFLLMASPLNLTGGVGSPANALAVK